MYTQEMSFGAEGLNSDRLKLAGGMPLFAPKLPWDISRFYFLFGKPISTAGVDVDNAEQCAALYEVCLDLCVCACICTQSSTMRSMRSMRGGLIPVVEGPCKRYVYMSMCVCICVYEHVRVYMCI